MNCGVGQLPLFLGGELSTPLDRLLPLIDAGGGPADVETLSAEWDGYWGLSTAEPTISAAPANIVSGNGLSELGLNPESDRVVPQVSGHRPVAASAGTSVAAAPPRDTRGGDDEAGIAFSNQQSVRKQQEEQLELQTAGAEKINFLLNQADQWIADANWLRAEKKLNDVLVSGEFDRWYPEPDDYGELYEILVRSVTTRTDMCTRESVSV